MLAKEPKWRNVKYWKTQFSNTSSTRFGYAITQIQQNKQHLVFGFLIYIWEKPARKAIMYRGGSWYIDDFDCNPYKWCADLIKLNLNRND